MPPRSRKLVSQEDAFYPPAPEGLVIYAIGDIHGRSDCLRTVHRRIDHDKSTLKPTCNTLEIYVGDFIDRGPNSYGVIEMILARARNTVIVCLKGNHERMMEAYLAGELAFEHWKSMGGLEALLSYDIDPLLLRHGGSTLLTTVRTSVPDQHKKFLEKTLPYLKLGNYCFVHAGLRPDVPLERQKLHDLTFIREEFLKYTGNFGCIVVHGHSPRPQVEFKRNRINLDTGAYATNILSLIRIDENGPALLADR